ncbi:MAG TPA: hypothetical protein VEB59_12235 [Gemmatimonadales bacterium]|nr:hypothetical protein [Gemmatimonadales bacterium]
MISPSRSLLPLALVLVACDPLPGPERKAIHDWLVCEECTEEQREAVVRLGDRGVPSMAQALRDAPRKGKRIVREQTRAMYARVAATAAVPEQQYVDEVVANYVATYQRRAALGLHEIGTPAAHDALVTAARDHDRYREDVMREIGQAIGIQLTVVQGDGQVGFVGAPVNTNPRVQVTDSTNGQPLWGIQVVFQVDSGGGQVSNSTRYTDLGGQTQVRWSLGLVPGVNVLRATAVGREVSFQATAQ